MSFPFVRKIPKLDLGEEGKKIFDTLTQILSVFVIIILFFFIECILSLVNSTLIIIKIIVWDWTFFQFCFTYSSLRFSFFFLFLNIGEKDAFFLWGRKDTQNVIFTSPSRLFREKTNVSFTDDGNDNNMTFYSRLFSTIINAQTTRILLKSSSRFLSLSLSLSSFSYNVLWIIDYRRL